MDAKAEIANYSIATSFGKGRRIRHDRKWTRPETRDDAIRQIEETYLHNRWKAVERAANARLCGLEPKPSLGDYTNDELKIILSDMERFGMIHCED